MTTLDYGPYNELVDAKKNALLKLIKSRLDQKQFDTVKLAFEVANNAHFNQRRKSGEPYITHPIEVATIIATWGLDEQTISGALLHDVVEDTDVTKGDLEQIFGTSIADLVDSVTKLEKLNFESDEIAHAEYFRKVVLAMAKDIRVILIKLADRLHNMLTLDSMKPEKRKRISLETMEIYVPIANKVGLHRVHLQLAEESFKHLYPYRYSTLNKAIEESQNKRLNIIESVINNLTNSLKSNGIVAQFIYHKRSVYNTHRRMRIFGQSFNRVNNVLEINIIVEKIGDCYLSLGVLHNMYQPLPGKFKDYIAIPKSNGYQSLHSTLMGPDGTPIQVHIRTKAMDEVAESGILCHWLKHQHDAEFSAAQKRTSSWISNILDIQSSTASANDFLNSLKQDLSPADIYVFTPKGKIILLPLGSKVLDFAYFIHTDVGNHCFRGKINHKLVDINTVLHNGDIVEIITKKEVEPNENWLKIAVSGKALSKIKQYFKVQKFDDDVLNGKRLVNLGLSLFNININEENIFKDLVANHYTRLSDVELQHKIGAGELPVLEVIKKILNYPKEHILEINLSQNALPIIQDNNCLPIPGEKILAKVTRRGELLIHLHSCKYAKTIGLDNLSFIHIINDIGKVFAIKMQANIANKAGTFAKVTGIIGEKGINIIELSQAHVSGDTASVSATIGVHTIEEAEDLINTLNEKDFIEKASLI